MQVFLLKWSQIEGALTIAVQGAVEIVLSPDIHVLDHTKDLHMIERMGGQG